MFFRKNGKWVSAVCAGLTVLLTFSCAVDRKLGGIMKGDVRADVSIPSDEDFRKTKEELLRGMIVDTVPAHAAGDPFIMNAIKDEETGEMVAVDVLSASTVVARFRNVAERFGKVSIEFDITVPVEMLESAWKLELRPEMRIMGDSLKLQPIHVSGAKYRDEQMKGYARYARFINSIITDSADFVRLNQIEVFIRRNFPATYAMKRDSSYVSDEQAQGLFGVTFAQVKEHYMKHGLIGRNDRKISDRDRMFRKFVKDPLVPEGLRLDTVINAADGRFIYRYVQEVASRPGLRRIDVSMDGDLYESGRVICSVQPPEDLAFYVSSLSGLVDPTPRYVMKILERTVYDNTHAIFEFEQGSAVMDTTSEGNSAELARIRRTVMEALSMKSLVLDSLKVTASCSPEGGYALNSKLAQSRAEAVAGLLQGVLEGENAGKLLSNSIPEDWDRLERLAHADTLLSEDSKREISIAATMQDKDRAESVLKRLPEYAYIERKLYPQLRNVRFDFYLHRRGMLKDTVHTSEPDTVYLAGVEAIRNLDYKRAVELLRPYHDYNTALAYLSAGYNHSALRDLEGLADTSPKADYLLAIVLSRLDRKKDAMEAYRRCVERDPSMIYRANLDPELSDFINKH